MFLVRGLLDRVLLICVFVAGGLIPGFIAQYRQRLGGRLDQAQLDLAPWQRLADQYYGGSLDKLIQYHLDSADPKFHAEGAVIRALTDSVQQLEAAVAAMHGSLLKQFSYLSLHGDPQLARATLHDWVPTFALSAEGLLFALGCAAVVWLLFQVLWWLGARLVDALRGRRGAPLHTRVTRL
jgi:hypothetical protein